MKVHRKRLELSARYTIVVVLCLAIHALVLPRAAQAQCDPEEVTKLTPSDGAEADHFGGTVSISGDGSRAIVGASGDDDLGSNAGSAYISRFDGAGWVEEAKLVASDGAENDAFGYSVAISSDGYTAVVGALSGDGQQVDSGSAYVFRYNGSHWTEEARLIASDGVKSDRFGCSVSISDDGTTIAVGAELADGRQFAVGSAYIFRYGGSEWIEEAKLLASDGGNADYFGNSVSLNDDGNTCIIGAPGRDESGIDSGADYVFRFNGSTWVEVSKLLASDGAAGDSFGSSVSICDDGSVAIVGARSDDDNGSNSGSAYVFQFNGVEWIEEAKLVPSDGGVRDLFGVSVSIDGPGETVIVGAYGDDTSSGPNSGSAYMFRFDGVLWVEAAKLLASDGEDGDEFGNAVSISGGATTAIFGAPSDDEHGTDSGSMYVFELNCIEPCLTLVVDDLFFHQPSRFMITNGTPGARAAIVWGLGGDPTRFVNLDGWCATFGFDIRLSRERIRLVASGLFDADGRFSARRHVLLKPGRVVYFQSAEQATCPEECMSNLVMRTVK